MKTTFLQLSPFLFAFLIPSVLTAPTSLYTRHDHNLSDSKSIPILNSGNALITSRYNIVYKQDTPDKPFTPEEKAAQGQDINRGFQKLSRTAASGDQLVEWGTIQVFIMPKEAEGRTCRVHFFMGSGDGTNGVARLNIFTLTPDYPFGEFSTTYNNRPPRGYNIATISVEPPQWVRERYARPDVTTILPNGDNWNQAAIVEWGVGAVPQQIHIPCPEPGKEVGFDLAPVSSREDGGMGQMAYSLNKGLALEILGIPREAVEPWDHFGGTQ